MVAGVFIGLAPQRHQTAISAPMAHRHHWRMFFSAAFSFSLTAFAA